MLLEAKSTTYLIWHAFLYSRPALRTRRKTATGTETTDRKRKSRASTTTVSVTKLSDIFPPSFIIKMAAFSSLSNSFFFLYFIWIFNQTLHFISCRKKNRAQRKDTQTRPKIRLNLEYFSNLKDHFYYCHDSFSNLKV